MDRVVSLRSMSMTVAQISASVERSDKHVENLLVIHDRLPDELRELYRSGQLSYDEARRLAGADDPIEAYKRLDRDNALRWRILVRDVVDLARRLPDPDDWDDEGVERSRKRSWRGPEAGGATGSVATTADGDDLGLPKDDPAVRAYRQGVQDVIDAVTKFARAKVKQRRRKLSGA